MKLWMKGNNGTKKYFTPASHVVTQFIAFKNYFEMVDHLNKNPSCDVYEGLLVSEKIQRKENQDNCCDVPCGVYSLEKGSNAYPERIEEYNITFDKYCNYYNFSDELKIDIEKFIKNENLYNKIGARYKRGYLLYGPPGNGKTTFISKLINDFKDKAIIIFCEKIPNKYILEVLSKDDRFKIFIFEEITTVIYSPLAITHLLSFLDGQNSPNKTITIATTNYADKLPGNIVERPSRFDLLFRFANPNAKDRKKILEYYLDRKIEKSEINATDNLSVASIKEVCILSQISDITIEQACKALQDRMAMATNDFSTKTLEGFSLKSNYYDDEDF